jgi:DNA-binding response OmpR family regulator
MDILLVEDDSAIASGLVYALEHEGYAVTHATTATDARARAGDSTFALAIIDLGLPDASGFDVAAALSCPFLFLTAVDDEANTVRGFDLGADDYITKPFRLRELLARVKAVIRRNSGDGDVLHIHDISIDIKAATVSKSGASIDLTSMEYKLLLVFAQNRGQALTRTQIIDALWDTDGNFVEDNTLTVYVKRLREKLGENVIETVRGIGYRCS